MKFSVNIALFLVLIIVSYSTNSKCSFTGNFKLRKTLDGSKNEMLPALMAYENNNSESYYNVDLASSIGSYSCGTERYDINTTPKIEFHRSTGNNEVRKSSIGINSDFSFMVFKHKTDKNSNLINPRWHQINPYFLSEVSVTRDSVNDKTTRKYSLLLSGYSLKHGGMGNPQSFSPNEGEQPNTANLHRFQWLPFIGIESYEQLAIVKDDIEIAPAINPTFRVAKLSIVYYPLKREYKSKKGLQVLANHTYRRLNSSSSSVDNSTNHFEFSINYFFDQKGHVGLGVDYEKGASPKRNFLDDKITTVALKLSW